MRLARILLLLLVLPALPAAAAVSYRVDSSGGPLTLSEEVAAAVLAWTRQVEGVELTEDSAGDMEVRFAVSEPAGAGPDTVTLTVQYSAGPVRLAVLVNPLLYQDHPAALLHEAGIMLGIGNANSGIMNPALSEATPTELSEADLEALRRQQASVPGDLTGDGVVDWHDLLELAAAYGQRGVNLAGDLDRDGVVTDQDLALLRELYEFRPPEETAVQETVQESAGTPAAVDAPESTGSESSGSQSTGPADPGDSAGPGESGPGSNGSD
jgi:hypothetical protein